jgi:hypothetical protein
VRGLDIDGEFVKFTVLEVHRITQNSFLFSFQKLPRIILILIRGGKTGRICRTDLFDLSFWAGRVEIFDLVPHVGLPRLTRFKNVVVAGRILPAGFLFCFFFYLKWNLRSAFGSSIH